MNDWNRYLHYGLTLTAPAIVANSLGEQHSAETRLFIPGGVMRGVIADLLLADGCNPSDEIFQTLVLSGQVRYLDAYPEIVGERAMPTPLSWCRPKDASSEEETGRVEIIDLSADDENRERDGEPFDSPFVSPVQYSGQHLRCTPRTGVHLHHQRDRQKGRAWKDDKGRGTIFRYRYLEPNQTFRGVIVFRPSSVGHLDRVKEMLLKEKVLIGRSRRAGYGGSALIEVVDSKEREYENLSGRLERDVRQGETFLLLCVSSYIGRDKRTGQIDPMAVDQEVKERLNGNVEVVQRFWRFEMVGGFRRKWGMEIPQVLAVCAGSVLVLRANTAIPAGLLRQVEDAGLGERKVEGFGRIVFVERGVWNGRSAKEAELKQSDNPERGEEGGVGGDVLGLIEKRLLIRAAFEAVERQAGMIVRQTVSDGNQALSIDSSTVLNRIRAFLRDAWEQDRAREVLDKLSRWCAQQGGHGEEARKKLRQFRLRRGRESLLEWLERLTDTQRFENLKEECSLEDVVRKHRLRTREENLGVLRGAEAVLCARLIDGVLAGLVRHIRR